MILFDLETDGFYEQVSVIHCIVTYDTELKLLREFNNHTLDGSIEDGLAYLAQADSVCGHNILGYDLPVIRKLSPGWTLKPGCEVLDTLILSRLLFPELGDEDDKAIKLMRLPPKYRGLHKLEAWGFRLGVLKDEYEGDFSEWTPDMQSYCVQDVRVTWALYKMLRKQEWPMEAVQLEHEVSRIISRQACNGFTFDVPAAYALLATLSKERLQLEEDLKAAFGWWWAKSGKEFVPKKDSKAHGYTAGAALTKIKQVYFNPSSRHHIARVLIKKFGWKPTALTPTGDPEVNEETLKPIKHPEARLLERFLMIQKRIGQLAEGKQAWLNYVVDGRIHGSVSTLGTVTGRMSHANPNIAQVPAVRSTYGPECRALFSARPGWSLVGADAAGLELRVLAHFMARFDAGAYVSVVVNGKKEDGTEIHTVNRKALEIDSRDDAKTWFYAFIYGAGNEKLGSIVTKVAHKGKNSKLGKSLRTKFLTNLPAMGTLIERIKAKADKDKALTGLDGRRLFIRSSHAAPNTLFQSAGAVVMKKALVILDLQLQSIGLVPGVDYEFVANIHDEWQIECRSELADQIGAAAVQAIRDAGTFYKFRCPLDGEYRVGRTWADTH